jgi:hypothetical protein
MYFTDSEKEEMHRMLQVLMIANNLKIPKSPNDPETLKEFKEQVSYLIDKYNA